ncbi:class II aldolase/adducin family protein [Candidatus Sororendozoicomonas aggregata]|uniref:class II aldolase/adducin family protein n=1 Tax=Candidatus Sororendozoicomonas aggregata TaxID=3073239 RepID=UPI002ED38413
MKMNYKRALSGKDVSVILIDEFNNVDLFNKARKTANKYDIVLYTGSSISEINNFKNLHARDIVHFIIRLTSKFSIELIDKVVKNIKLDYKSVSIAFSYKDYNESLKFKECVNKSKCLYSNLDCFNLMRPDTHLESSYTASTMKIVDNIICDTIRIKYHAVCLSRYSIKNEIPKDVADFFSRASHLYGAFQMYHRSNTDGYFSIKKDDKIYITATKTQKDKNLSFDRICVIHNYNERENAIYYSGSYVPSSDSVEAMIVYNNNREINSIIHTHDSIRFTRNPLAISYDRIEPIEYGTAELGYRLSERISNGLNVIIMEEHGEIFVGKDDYTACNTLLDEVSKMIN